MGWIKRKLRQMVQDALYDRQMDEGIISPTTVSQADRIMHDAQLMIAAIPIDNGFLLRIERDRSRVVNTMQNVPTTLIFCKDATEIAEQIVAHYTKQRMGIDPHVNVGSLKSAHIAIMGGGGGGYAANKPNP